MYLIMNGDKGSYDRPINITLVDNLKTANEASDYLKEVLIGWLLQHERDVDLLAELGYDNDKYVNKLKTRVKTRITKAIRSDMSHVEHGDYGFYNITQDLEGNLTFISTGCPSDNEYDGESYQVIYI